MQETETQYKVMISNKAVQAGYKSVILPCVFIMRNVSNLVTLDVSNLIYVVSTADKTFA